MKQPLAGRTWPGPVNELWQMLIKGCSAPLFPWLPSSRCLLGLCVSPCLFCRYTWWLMTLRLLGAFVHKFGRFHRSNSVLRESSIFLFVPPTHTLPHMCQPYLYTWTTTIWRSPSRPSEQTKCLDEIRAAVSGNPNSFRMACGILLKAKAHLWHSSGGFGRSNCSGNKPFTGDKWALSVPCFCICTPQPSSSINHSWIWPRRAAG